MRAMRLAAVVALILVGCRRAPVAQDAGARGESGLLRLEKTIELPGVEGRFDHFASDPKGKRLFVAALGNGTLEVIDTAAGRQAGSVTGLRKPTGVAFVPETGEVVVAGGDDGTVRFYDAGLKEVARVEGLGDADNVRYDAAAGRLYVGYGDGGLAVIDARGHKKVGDVRLDAHPESFQWRGRGHGSS
jgi:YVTN family beta-propeller protein